MLRLWRYWVERGWTVIGREDYASAWSRFGGSVATHPDIVERLAGLAKIPVKYLGWYEGEQLVAAIPCWGHHLALSKKVLKSSGKRRLFDLGDAKVILPVADQACVPVRHKTAYVLPLKNAGITTLRKQSDELAIARSPESYKRKWKYNMRRSLRLLREAGGDVQPISAFDVAERARIYADLFFRRWGFEAPGKPTLVEVFDLLQEFMAGSVIMLKGEPIAIQVIYRVEAPKWISMEYINGGFDPAHEQLAPGSVLMFVNTQAAWEEAQTLNKELYYSFGRAGCEYKDIWCHRTPVYQT